MRLNRGQNFSGMGLAGLRSLDLDGAAIDGTVVGHRPGKRSGQSASREPRQKLTALHREYPPEFSISHYRGRHTGSRVVSGRRWGRPWAGKSLRLYRLVAEAPSYASANGMWGLSRLPRR